MSDKNFEIADIIFKYVKGNITDDQLEELRRWLDESDRHVELFKRLNGVRSFKDKQEIHQRFDPYYDFERVRKNIRRENKYLFRKYVAIAAAVMLPLLIMLVMWQRETPGVKEVEVALIPGKEKAVLILSDGSTKDLEQAYFDLRDGDKRIVNEPGKLMYSLKDTIAGMKSVYNEIKVPRGGEYQVVLADGTRVWLNSESSIRFPVTFQGSERKVWVSGEVFLDVAKDENHPFIVNSGEMDLKVLGTMFNVRVYADEHYVMTTLVEGSVQATGMSGKAIVLRPSEQLVYNKETGEEEVRVVDTELFISWKDGVYFFKSQRLEDIMGVIARWYDVEVFYQNAEVKNVLFSGRLKRYENAEILLNVFEQLGGVQFVVQGRTVLVKTE